MLAVKSRKKRQEIFFFVNINLPRNDFFYIPSSYAKIWGQTKFQPREFPQSGSKAIDVEDRRAKVSDYNGQF